MAIDGNTPITLTLTLDDVNVINAALVKLPYEAVSDLIGKVRGTALSQIAALERAPTGDAIEEATA